MESERREVILGALQRRGHDRRECPVGSLNGRSRGKKFVALFIEFNAVSLKSTGAILGCKLAALQYWDKVDARPPGGMGFERNMEEYNRASAMRFGVGLLDSDYQSRRRWASPESPWCE